MVFGTYIFWICKLLQLIQLTKTSEYEGSPTWSPDGQWIAFESYAKGNLDIYLLEIAHPENAPLQLTDDPATDFSPRWMTGGTGRQIAFVSDRSGEDEIWMARLDDFKQRFINISLDAESKDTHPAWSPDGRYLSWAKKTGGDDSLVVWDTSDTNSPAKPAGTGDWPVWNPSGTTIASRVRQANLTALASYETSNRTDQHSFDPLARSTYREWIGAITNYLRFWPHVCHRLHRPQPRPLWSPTLVQDPMPAGLDGLVSLDGVSAPFPALLDSLDEAYVGLRNEIGQRVGWDFMNSLEDAFMTLDAPSEPGTVNSWLSTGRGISLNDLPMNSGWMALVREELGTQTYWRIFLKTRAQDGSQGRPMTEKAWDIISRNSGDPTVYEKGGKETHVPEGYWVDFTEWAGRFGWDRFPALSNWVTYYPGARFKLFALTEGLDLNKALNQMYPSENFSRPGIRPTLTPFPTPKPAEPLYPTSTPVTNE